MSDRPAASLDTLCIHAGQEPDPVSRRGDDADRPVEHVRAGRARRAQGATTTRAPATRRARALEGCLAALEGAKHGIAFGSGCAATTAILLTLEERRSRPRRRRRLRRHVPHLRQGDEAVRPRGDVPRHERSRRRCSAAMRPNTQLVWMETPSNPMLKIFDIAAIAEIAREAGACARRRQHVRHADAPAAARARRDDGRALDDEVPERPLRRRRRRRDDERRRARRAAALPPEGGRRACRARSIATWSCAA